MRKWAVLAVVLLATVVAAGCGGGEETGEPAAAPAETAATGAAADACARESLELVNDGTLTIGTDNPAYPPWFEGGTTDGSEWELNDPATGEGYESAVAYAVAEQLGFSADEVAWTVVPFDQIFKPGEKSFDFAINQVSITEEREQAVDFSESYYDVNQALVAREGSPVAEASSTADLRDAKLGVQVGTTSFSYVDEQIQPTTEPAVFNTSNDVVTALKNGQVDGIVTDLPTAFYLVAAELEDGVLVGQFPNPGGTQEQFGLVLEEGNPLRDCVNRAIQQLREDGTIEQIHQEWLADKADAPVLE